MPAKTEPVEAFECFASDETKTVKLKGTRYWVEIKRYLTDGEQTDIDSALFESVSAPDAQAAAASGQKMYLSLSKQKFLKMASFVADWNLCNAKGITVPLRGTLQEKIAIMRSLSKPMAALIVAAVDEVAGEELASMEADPEDPNPPGGAVATG